MVNHINYIAGLGLSDHACLLFDLNVYTAPNSHKEPKYRYHKGNYEDMNTYLKGIDWVNTMTDMDTETAWKFFEAEFLKAVQKFIPKTRPDA